MGQADVLRELEEAKKKLESKLRNILDEDRKLDNIWKDSLSKEDLASLIGVSIQSIKVSVMRLLNQKKIVSLKNSIDKRKRKYVINDDLINDLVGERRD